MKMNIVLGRFQPLHKGHVHLIEAALALGEVTIAIGSSRAELGPDNPWTGDEREAMIRAWLDGREANIVQIADINDPPNWVAHARKFHGEGTLVTSDEGTRELYEEAGFPVHWVDLENRDSLEGWRVRTTLKMLSTVYEQDAMRAVMSASIPEKVVDWLIDNDGIHRLYTFSEGLEHAG